MSGGGVYDKFSINKLAFQSILLIVLLAVLLFVYQKAEANKEYLAFDDKPQIIKPDIVTDQSLNEPLSNTAHCDDDLSRDTVAVSARSSEAASVFKGIASWYGKGDGLNGAITASGEIFNKDDYTAAHPTLSFGSRVRVTYPKTGKSVEVRINDRGPFSNNRIIDLSMAAAEAIGLRSAGIGEVIVEVLK